MAKKIFSSIIACIFVVSIIATNVSAVSLNAGSIAKDVENTNSYITLDDAKLLAQHTISNKSAHDNECPWNSDTKIEQVIPLYDLDNNINAYVLNLENNNKNVGYMIINCNSNDPAVEMFSYRGLFNAETYTNKSTNKKIYHMDTLNLLVEKNEFNKEAFYNIKTNSKIDIDKNTLKAEYKKYINIKNDNSKKMLNNLKLSKFNIGINTNSMVNTTNSIIAASSQVIYEKHDVPYYDRAHFYTVSETLSYYPGGGNCGPTAGLTIVMYWARLRGKTKLCYNSSVPASYNSIYADMQTIDSDSWWGGTAPANLDNGLWNYAKWAGCPVTDCYWYQDGSPSFYCTQQRIAEGAPLIFGINNSSNKYGNHYLDIFGTERDNDGNWLRVADGWDSEYKTNYQMWYRYESLNPYGIFYFSWK